MASGWNSQVYLVWLGMYSLINYLSNTITNSNNDINITKHRHPTFIDFWGGGGPKQLDQFKSKMDVVMGYTLKPIQTNF